MRQYDSTTFERDTYYSPKPVGARVGGLVSDAFLPNINIWDWPSGDEVRGAEGETFVNLNLPVQATASDVLRSNTTDLSGANSVFQHLHDQQGRSIPRVQWEHSGMSLFIYPLNDRVMETGVVWETRPSDNSITLELAHSGMNIQRQTFLSEREIPSGVIYRKPPRAEGSLMFFHPNQWTDKYMGGGSVALFRFELIDSAGRRAASGQRSTDPDDIDISGGWHTFSNGGKEYVTTEMPGWFLDRAEREGTFPVIAIGMGDTLGFSGSTGTIFGFGSESSGHHALCGPWSITSTESGDEINADCEGGSGDTALFGVWEGWEENVSAGTVVVDATAQTGFSSPSQVETFSLDSSQSFTGGTDYFLGFAYDGDDYLLVDANDDASSGIDTAFGAGSYTGGDSLSTMAAAPGTVYNDVRCRIWITTAAGGGAQPSYPCSTTT